jgi:hypothetical protein
VSGSAGRQLLRVYASAGQTPSPAGPVRVTCTLATISGCFNPVNISLGTPLQIQQAARIQHDKLPQAVVARWRRLHRPQYRSPAHATNPVSLAGGRQDRMSGVKTVAAALGTPCHIDVAFPALIPTICIILMLLRCLQHGKHDHGLQQPKFASVRWGWHLGGRALCAAIRRPFGFHRETHSRHKRHRVALWGACCCRCLRACSFVEPSGPVVDVLLLLCWIMCCHAGDRSSRVFHLKLARPPTWAHITITRPRRTCKL